MNANLIPGETPQQKISSLNQDIANIESCIDMLKRVHCPELISSNNLIDLLEDEVKVLNVNKANIQHTITNNLSTNLN